MSDRFPGGVISATPVVPTPSSAPGIWTLDQQEQAQKAGTWPFGGPFTYIEDVFSTYLYTGNGSTQTITNGIDLAGKGGMVWCKGRSTAYHHAVFDTARGASWLLETDTTIAQEYDGGVTAFNANGFSLDSWVESNANGATQVSWTFRKQPKFFDVVTYTGDGTSNRQISHSLGSEPGCMIIKRTDSTGNWFVYHRSIGNTYALLLQTTDAQAAATIWNNTSPTSTNFTVQGGANTNGGTYIAYLFAHNAGGFGLTGTDNVISCGSFTTNASGAASVNLGYEPQWVMWKASSGSSSWYMSDVMRGMSRTGYSYLFANLNSAEDFTAGLFSPTATGFETSDSMNSNTTYIYIAIRRGPMKVPTDGTKVYNAVSGTGGSTTIPCFISGFPVDFAMVKNRAVNAYWADVSRLQGSGIYLQSSSTAAEATNSFMELDYSTGWSADPTVSTNFFSWMFQRAPGFFDEVCYTGTGSATTFSHNLGVAPELMIVKSRSAAGTNWKVYQKDLGTLYGSGNPAYQYNLTLNSTASTDYSLSRWSQDPTSTVFGVATNADTNGSGTTYVNYLFASCPGVSKVGSYTGTGSTQTIACGFTGGARFVLIKRTDSTGNWGVLDTARGMVSGTDPYLNLNTTAAEVNANNVYTTTGGFQLVSSDANFNANGGSYIFLAVA